MHKFISSTMGVGGLFLVFLLISSGFSQHDHKSGDGTDMMKMDKKGSSSGVEKATASFSADQISGLFSAYLGIQDGLAGDNLKTAQTHAAHFDSLAGEAGNADLKLLKAAAMGIKATKDIKTARVHFIALSSGLIGLLDQNTHAGEATAMVFHCPMAADGKGADWLQSKDGTRNPYYGKMMLTCGSKVRTIENKH